MAKINPARLKESETVEFKEQFNDSAFKTLAAFVNSKGDGFVAKLYGDYLFVVEKIKGIDLNKRQRKIVQYAQEGEFKLSDISDLFDDFHKRTLRRDLKELVNKQILKAEGEKHGRVYYLNRS